MTHNRLNDKVVFNLNYNQSWTADKSDDYIHTIRYLTAQNLTWRILTASVNTHKRYSISFCL